MIGSQTDYGADTINGGNDGVIDQDEIRYTGTTGTLTLNLTTTHIERISISTGVAALSNTGGAGTTAVSLNASAVLGDFSMYGNGGANTLTGGGGNNIINGFAGNDVLTGGGGNDTFVFNTALAANIDRITDFNVIDDTIQLSSGIFAGMPVSGFFSSGTTAPTTTSTNYIYLNTSSGALYYDTNGAAAGGAPIQFATIDLVGAVRPILTEADFAIV